MEVYMFILQKEHVSMWAGQMLAMEKMRMRVTTDLPLLSPRCLWCNHLGLA